MSSKTPSQKRSDIRDLESVAENIDPGTNTENVIKDAHKDHTKGVNAFLFEGGQNAIDAYWHRKANGLFEHRALSLHFRVSPEMDMVEIWDNAGGMTKEKLVENYLRFGNPGDEKQHSDTGGSQGKGSWVMIGWGERAYIESVDENGDRWWCTANPENDGKGNRSKIQRLDSGGREELDESGTYIRIHGLSNQTVSDLTDVDSVISKLEEKFPFALAHDNISIEYEVVGDGVYKPESHDFAALFKEGGIVEGETLDEVSIKGEARQLEGLHLIDNRKTSLSEPPWNGVAMLKGGEYVTDDDSEGHPYLNVWTYAPNNNPVTREGKLWGWVDASSLCPDLEEHGHTGFVGSDIYTRTGLRQAIIKSTKEHFDSQTVSDKGSSSKYVRKQLNKWLDRMDNVDKSKQPEKDGHPKDPEIFCHADGEGKQVGDDIPLSMTIETPNRCRVTDVHIYMKVERIRDGDGEKIPKGERSQTTNQVTAEIESGLTDGKELGDAMFTVKKPGKYRFEAELRQKPNVDESMNSMDLDDNSMAFSRKPVLSSSYTMFSVGDFDVDTVSSPGTGESAASVIRDVYFKKKDGAKWRVQMRATEEEGVFDVFVNSSHPEFKAIVDKYGVGKKGDVQAELGMRWGFLRVFMQRAGDEIETVLREHGVSQSEVKSDVTGVIQKRLEEYDEFRHESIGESPLYGE
jgi:hypothetical protein